MSEQVPAQDCCLKQLALFFGAHDFARFDALSSRQFRHRCLHRAVFDAVVFPKNLI
jgi:hypothetical protein